MTDLGPMGRTKHTDDERPPSGARPYGGQGKLMSPTRQAVQEIKRLRTVLSLMRWMLISMFTGLCLWLAVTAIVQTVRQPERDRRIEACAVAMASESAREASRAPIPQCEPLSVSERREAAYVYAKREGLL